MSKEIKSRAQKIAGAIGATGFFFTGVLVGCDVFPNSSGVDQCYAGVCSGHPGNGVVTGQQLPLGSQASRVTVTPNLPNSDGDPPVWPTFERFDPRATYQAPTAPPKAGPEGQVATPVVPQEATPTAGLARGSRKEKAPKDTKDTKEEDQRKKADEMMRRILEECRKNGTIRSEREITYAGSVKISREVYDMINDAYPLGSNPVLSWKRTFTGEGYVIYCDSFAHGARYPFENEKPE